MKIRAISCFTAICWDSQNPSWDPDKLGDADTTRRLAKCGNGQMASWRKNGRLPKESLPVMLL